MNIFLLEDLTSSRNLLPPALVPIFSCSRVHSFPPSLHRLHNYTHGCLIFLFDVDINKKVVGVAFLHFSSLFIFCGPFAQVTARLFMGKGEARSARVQVPLSARDGEEEKAKQWAALREAFLTDQQVNPRSLFAA